MPLLYPFFLPVGTQLCGRAIKETGQEVAPYVCSHDSRRPWSICRFYLQLYILLYNRLPYAPHQNANAGSKV